ncbi:MAG: hypothetical protein O2954_15875, partial [bacterium]|nr:hypothetical protein [bacterium]
DIILISGGGDHLQKDLDRLRTTPGWKTVHAIKTGRVYDISLDLLGRPGPRLVDGLENLAHALHPDQFPQ